MNRRLLALVFLGALVALAGCSSVFGPGQPSSEDLNAPAEYDWQTNATTTVNVTHSVYHTVITVQNRSELEIYRQTGIGTEEPVDLKALRFRYPNGTVVNASALTVQNTQSRTKIDLPARRGKVGFSVSRAGKQFSAPVFVAGSYQVTLPTTARVAVPFLAQVSPGGFEKTFTDEGRVRLRWEEIESGTVIVRYYLQRDLWLFAGLLGILLLAGAGGTLYYVRKIRELERQREEVGLDVDTDEFDGRDPPPGMG